MKKYLLLLPLFGFFVSCGSKITDDNLFTSLENLSGYWETDSDDSYDEEKEILIISLPYDDNGNCWFVYKIGNELNPIFVLEGSVNILNIPYKTNQWGDDRKHLNLVIKNTSLPNVSKKRFSNWIYIEYESLSSSMLRTNGLEIGSSFRKIIPDGNYLHINHFRPDNFKKKFWKL